MSDDASYKRIAQFLFEIGTMRKVLRSHRQMLMEDDLTDNIATHTYRVAMIGWQLAKLEGADPYKTMAMCMVHDIEEIRGNDHNWIHKRYVKIYEDEILQDQLGALPDNELFELAKEYNARESKEAVIAKDADLLDQVFLLKEYAARGNEIAKRWLGKRNGGEDPFDKLRDLQTNAARELGKVIYEEEPDGCWEGLWTNKNR